MGRPNGGGLTGGEWLFVCRVLAGDKHVEAVAFAFPKIHKQDRRHEYAKKLLARPEVARTLERLRKELADRGGAGAEAIWAKLFAMFSAAPVDGLKAGDAVKIAKLILEGIPGALQPRKVKLEASGPISIRFVREEDPT